MIVKKLLAPFLNRGGILTTAENCYIASAAVSEPAFEMLMGKVSKKCKVFMVTGLDLPTSPVVLRKILKEYSDRVTLKIYTRNFFHPKVYVFDLPFRKRIAFIGSADFTMGGLQRNEELSWQIDNDKQVEELKVWFERYFEDGEDLTERLIDEYEKLYPLIKEREAITAKQKQQVIDLVSGRFNWDNVDFSSQYFKRADYDTFESTKENLDTPEIRAERISVRKKFLDLHEQLESALAPVDLHAHDDVESVVSSIELLNHHDNRIKAMWLGYGRSKNEIKRYPSESRPMDLMRLQVIIHHKDVGIWLMPGKAGGSKEDREFFRVQMKSPKYRLDFFKALRHLGREYLIEVASDKRPVYSFKDQDELWAFTKLDDWMNHPFIIGRNYMPDALELSETTIVETVMTQFQKLLPLYVMMKDKTFERNPSA
jgi:hypothetical protein